MASQQQPCSSASSPAYLMCPLRLCVHSVRQPPPQRYLESIARLSVMKVATTALCSGSPASSASSQAYLMCPLQSCVCTM